MSLNYDESKFRILAIGERVIPGDYYYNGSRGMYEPAPIGLTHPMMNKEVFIGLENLYLRPISPDVATRKSTPIATGFIDYFPLAIAEVARLSKVGNDQHNPGKPLHWDRSKSGDEGDALMRHFVDRGKLDTDGVRHSAKVAWRALAMLQKELEAAQ